MSTAPVYVCVRTLAEIIHLISTISLCALITHDIYIPPLSHHISEGHFTGACPPTVSSRPIFSTKLPLPSAPLTPPSPPSLTLSNLL